MTRSSSGPAPDQGGPREVLETERASATPNSPTLAANSAPRAEARAIGPGARGPLAELERWFSEVIAHPESVAQGIEDASPIQAKLGVDDVEQIVTASERLSVEGRLGLYHYAYRARLVECLEDDFPSVRSALGDEAFEKLCQSYITDHPSDRPSLVDFGRHFSSYCAAKKDLALNPRFISDLARLEWSIIEVFHAEAAPTLSMSLLQQIPEEEWPGIRLPTSATLALRHFEYPVNRYFQATRDGQHPPVPEPQASATAIYRKGFGVWRMDLSAPMARVLDALLGGQPLGEALGQLRPAEAEENDVMRWFSEWVSGGFFAAIEPQTPKH